jgi:toxin ParE1/3/4
MKQIVWTDTALQRLDDLLEIIAQEDIHIANEIIDEINDVLNLVSMFPELGKMMDHQKTYYLRVIVIRRVYMLSYWFTDDILYVLSIRHSRQQY